MMNAGSRVYHEELSLEEGSLLEGLQILIRPEMNGLKPRVQFHQLHEIYSINHWRKMAGKGNDYPLQIRSNTWLMDIQLEKVKDVSLQDVPGENITHSFAGCTKVNENISLTSGESVLIEDGLPEFHALETSDIALFITQTPAVHFDGGMYSGNQTNR